MACDGVARIVSEVLHDVHDRHALRGQLRGGGMHGIIKRTIKPQANRLSGRGRRLKARSRQAARIGTLLAAHRASGESAGMSSRSRAFAGSTARTAAPAVQFLATRPGRTDTPPASLLHGFDPCAGAKLGPARARLVAQAVDKRLPAAVEIPDVAGESELQLVDGRRRPTSARGRRSRCSPGKVHAATTARLPGPMVWSSQSRRDTPSNGRVSSFASVVKKRASRHFSRMVKSREPTNEPRPAGSGYDAVAAQPSSPRPGFGIRPVNGMSSSLNSRNAWPRQ